MDKRGEKKPKEKMKSNMTEEVGIGRTKKGKEMHVAPTSRGKYI